VKVSRKVLFGVYSRTSPAEQSEHSSIPDREGIGASTKVLFVGALVKHGGLMEVLDGTGMGGVDSSHFLEMILRLEVGFKIRCTPASKIACLTVMLLGGLGSHPVKGLG